MYRVVLHKQNVPRLECAGRTLHRIAHTAGKEQNKLVKLVKMEVPLLPRRVAQVKIAVIFQQVTGLAYLIFLHGHTSRHFRFYRTLCDISR